MTIAEKLLMKMLNLCKMRFKILVSEFYAIRIELGDKSFDTYLNFLLKQVFVLSVILRGK